MDDTKKQQTQFVAQSFRDSLQSAVNAANMLFDTCGVPKEERTQMFATVLLGSAAGAAKENSYSRETFDALAKQIADRVFGQEATMPVTSTKRGLA